MNVALSHNWQERQRIGLTAVFLLLSFDVAKSRRRVVVGELSYEL